jgi:hypothetical protein
MTSVPPRGWYSTRSVPQPRFAEMPARRGQAQNCTMYHPLRREEIVTALASKPKGACCQGGTCTAYHAGGTGASRAGPKQGCGVSY